MFDTKLCAGVFNWGLLDEYDHIKVVFTSHEDLRYFLSELDSDEFKWGGGQKPCAYDPGYSSGMYIDICDESTIRGRGTAYVLTYGQVTCNSSIRNGRIYGAYIYEYIKDEAYKFCTPDFDDATIYALFE